MGQTGQRGKGETGSRSARERSECERVRISGRSPALGAVAGLDYRLGQAKGIQRSRTTRSRRYGRDHGLIQREPL